jgi:4-hydroxyacetophenone monooxygenase
MSDPIRLNPRAAPITASDHEIRGYVEDAQAPPPPLLASIAALTGDLSLLRDDLRFDPLKMLEPDAGYTSAQLAAARELAIGALIAFRDRGSVPAPFPEASRLRTIFEWVAGEPVTDDMARLLREEIALDGDDLRAPDWTVGALAPDRDLRVAIVGAGMSGIVMGHRLAQAGVPFVILEKNADVGGTWLENSYPGCRVDIPNHFYSYSFAQTHDWPQFYSTGDVLLEYFRACVDEFGLRQHIRFETEVLGAAFDDEQQTWTVRTRAVDGTESDLVVQALISAVGQLNRPMLPDIEGHETFTGPSFHSARWDHSVDLEGKRVAIIGTGASAVQLLPQVAEEAATVAVFQRTPPWLLPVDNYMDDVSPGLRWIETHVSGYARWDRVWIMARTNEGLLPLCRVDPDWSPNDRSVSATNDFLREVLTSYYDTEFTDPDLRARVLPHYPPIAKRVILDNGSVPRTLQRDNVELVTDAITAIDEHGVVMGDGSRRDVDVIVYGTGFEASKFLTPMQISGSGGVDLHDRWAGDARAYLGITVPSFPNLFLMYGPNTNIVINGSIIYFSECEAHYIIDSIRMLLEHGARSMECRSDVHDRYNERIDAGNRSMAWGASDVNSWYKNEFGRVAQNWPFTLLEYWRQTRRADPDDYQIT